MLGKQGEFDQITVAGGRRRHARAARRARSRRSCPPTVNVRTGAEEAEPQSRRSADNLGFLKTFLLIFAGVVAVRRRVPHLQHVLDHRRPAHARVRAAADARRLAPPGARARCVIEALLLGLVGSLLGLARRARARRPGIKALFDAVGVDLPAHRARDRVADDHRAAARRHVVDRCSSSLAPALRATRVPPMAALREAAAPTRGRAAAALTVVAGVLLAVLGVVARRARPVRRRRRRTRRC